MTRIAYVNGAYVQSRDAVVPIEDRGYQFADGVYEVCEVFQGALIDEERHLGRLARSLAELRIDAPVKPAALKIILREVLARNKVVRRLSVFAGDARRGPARSRLPAAAGAAEPRRHGAPGRSEKGRSRGQQRHRRHLGSRHSMEEGRH